MSKVIIGTGSDLPTRIITNEQIEASSMDYDRARAGASLHEWTMARTGVALRHRVGPGEGTSDMATRAARRALDDAGIGSEEIDIIVLSTFTSDYRLPQSVSIVQRNLGCEAKCFQLEAACAGFIDAIITASALLDALHVRTALVVSSEAMSAVVDSERFMCQTIFGDGAGAVVLRDIPGSRYGLKAYVSHTRGRDCEWTRAPGGGTKAPITERVLAERSQYLEIEYRNVYRFAVDHMVESTHEVLRRAGVALSDVDWIVPHQAGRNVLVEMATRLDLPLERFCICLDHTGNTSSASIPIALDEACRASTFCDGARVVIPAVGAGMAWGALYLIWADHASLGART
ncbi:MULTISPECIES: 3-oxoacyl-ACP synthase III family protein [Sorangium]|uniref:3-oxoacyl-ACP synthase III n=1 Tax=Sorangium cellulosum TaxID=56 RepID=A0A4P2R762_SORCE|nr:MULTISPECIES: beta-ketoacyl-ACP synthase 3 [Sorangium]AUX38581.1 3-oxoacyl-ACP synthase III [Sorangium cellulosum]WCQ97866.1 3-oxoacyl-[acyl-carrier-protein] synthase 3 [Sorangium sp. Soce836]